MKNSERPSNPAEISFAAHCFVQIGTCTEYSVAYCKGSIGYPPKFGTDRAAAEAFSRRTGHPVVATEVPVMKRISWR